MLRFDGRVAVITGAGGGLGREYALLLAKHGASVIVNDLGGSRSGEGQNASLADRVVQEIKKFGGIAVANYDSVEDGEKIIQTAINAYGRVDVLVNNAGILRDKSFANMTNTDWDVIQRVHLRGSYLVTKAAWPYFKKQSYGRIIMTSSTSGIYGNFGQANYAAAKMGLIGLCNTLAREGAKYNVFCNTIVPTAGSRLTQDVMPPEMVEAFKPSHIAPMVAVLCHEGCGENGGVFEAGGGWFGKMEWNRSGGAKLVRSGDPPVTPEIVKQHWDTIINMEDSRSFPNASEAIATCLDDSALIESGPKSELAADTGAGINPALCRGYKLPLLKHKYDTRDVIMYSLGVGASAQSPIDLRYLYENHEYFQVLPGFLSASALRANTSLFSGGVPGLQGVDLVNILHGEEFLEIYKPIPTSGTFLHRATVADVLDKGSGALILVDVNICDQSGEKLAFCQMAIFARGLGKFGGPRTSASEKSPIPVPQRNPDLTLEQKTYPDQAAVYRLSGDPNPLHIDPEFAKMAGFNQPILHGLSSYGFAVRQLVEACAGGDCSKIRTIKARFSSPVIPGQTLITEVWRGEGNRIHFQSKVKESGKVAIGSGYIDLTQPPNFGINNSTMTKGGSELSSAQIFQALGDKLKDQPDIVKKAQAVFLWVITKAGSEAAKYTTDLKNGAGAVYAGEPKNGEKPAATLTLSDEAMVQLIEGKLNPQQAFMSGKLKVKGNLMMTQKLQTLLKAESKL